MDYDKKDIEEKEKETSDRIWCLCNMAELMTLREERNREVGREHRTRQIFQFVYYCVELIRRK